MIWFFIFYVAALANLAFQVWYGITFGFSGPVGVLIGLAVVFVVINTVNGFRIYMNRG